MMNLIESIWFAKLSLTLWNNILIYPILAFSHRVKVSQVARRRLRKSYFCATTAHLTDALLRFYFYLFDVGC